MEIGVPRVDYGEWTVKRGGERGERSCGEWMDGWHGVVESREWRVQNGVFSSCTKCRVSAFAVLSGFHVQGF